MFCGEWTIKHQRQHQHQTTSKLNLYAEPRTSIAIWNPTSAATENRIAMLMRIWTQTLTSARPVAVSET